MDDLRSYPVPFDTWPGRNQRIRVLYKPAPPQPHERMLVLQPAPVQRLLARLHHLYRALFNPTPNP